MQRYQENSVVYYQFESLRACRNLIHGVFTRLGGASPPPFSTLNLGRAVGDSDEAVEENYVRVCRTLGIPRGSLVTGHQTHSDHVAVVGIEDRGRMLPHTDGLVTHSPGVCLTLRFADCVPLLFLDSRKNVIALAHAGWKGTLKKIGSKTVQVLRTQYGSHPEDIIACIGPSIGSCCYQVGQDVIDAVRETFPGSSEGLLLRQNNGAVHLDLWAANRLLLEEEGVTQIESAGICTSCRRAEFFSHRGDRGRTGRFGVFIAIEDAEG